MFPLKNRNQCGSGGFQNGKTYIGCLKLFILLSTFPKYRAVVARQIFKDLKETTLRTFFKICPPEFVKSHSDQEGKTILKNGSEILWMHLDAFDEQALRGLEINSVLLDQAEEIEESIYLVLDSRIGRWEKVEVPARLLKNNPNWPLTKLGNYKVPSYHMVLCNPDSQFHWIYRRYHPDSLEKLPDHVMIQAGTDPTLGDEETYKQMLSRDPDWVKRYVKGEWGISDSQIHFLDPASILEPNEELLQKIHKKGNLYRILDHGDSSPTCCLWAATLDHCIIFYREYYVPRQLISYHRSNINALSIDEIYSSNYADPSIFKKSSQKDGGFWSVADEYLTNTIDAPGILWVPADNNEFATRNRINELLSKSSLVKHPITGESPAPQLYFIKRTPEYSQGCYHSIIQLQSQRREKIGEMNGKIIYSDERQESIEDHAYDCVRYRIAMHGTNRIEPKRKPPARSFEWFRHIAKNRKQYMKAGSV